MGPKIVKFKIFAWRKVGPPFQGTKFHGKSDGDSLDALRPKTRLNPKMGHKALLEPKIEKFKICTRRKVRPPYKGKISRRIGW